MKVLFIGSERSDAQAIATALRGIDHSVSVSWAAHLQHAVRWLNENRDLAALVVDAQVDGGAWPSLVAHARSLELHPAVVVIVPDGSGDAIPADADNCIPRNQSLLRDLPVVVARALERAVRSELERKLAAADRLLAEQQAKYDIGMARAAATWDMVDEQLRAAALQVEHARQQEESAAADAERLARRESELYSQLATAAAHKGTLERRLADAQSSVEAAHARTEQERAEAARQLSEQQHLFETQLTEAVRARRDAEQRHASALAEIARLTQHEDELKTVLAEVSAGRTELEGKLAATEAAFEDAVTRTTRERLAASKKAADREAELDGQVRRERAIRGDLEQALASARITLDTARRDHQSAAADVERLTEREAELLYQLENVQSIRATLEVTLADANDRLRDAQQRHESATAAAAAEREHLTQREADLVAQLADVQDARHTVEGQLADATTALHDATTREAELRNTIAEAERALRDAQQRHETALATAAAELADLRARFDRELTQATTERHHLADRLSETSSALDEARRDHQSAAADVARLTQHGAGLASQLADATSALRDAATREAELRNAIAEGEGTLRDAQQRRDTALATAAVELEELRARFDRELTQATTDRHHLADRLSETSAALDEARRDYQSAAADVARLSQHGADLASQLADVQDARDALERQLADATSALQDAATGEVELRNAIAEAEGALRDAQQRHDTAVATAASELADLRGRFDRELTQATTERHHLADRLSETASALDEARSDHQSAAADVARLTQHGAGLASQLADATSALQDAATREAELRNAIAEGEGTLRDAQQRHDTALATAAAELVDQRARFDHELTQATTDRHHLADRLSETSAALEEARRDHQSAAADVARLTQHGADLASQFADVQAARDALERQLTEAAAGLQNAAGREADLAHQVTEANAARVTLEHQLEDARRAIREAAARQADVEEQLELERAGRAELEEDLANAQATRTSLEQTLADSRARFVEQRQQLEIQLAQEQLEHESRTSDLEKRTRALTLERDTLQQSLTSQQERSRRLQDSLSASTEAFEASRTESHRLFDQASVAMFRCTREGALTDANRACATLVGRRTLDELAGIDIAAAVFEAPQALSWLIERCVSTRTRESIETTWRRHDGSRLFMRLSARSLPGGVIEVIAEDLTRLRVLEERLGHAHRMEAVGRLASEVAITCSNLLDSIQQQGREWLMTSARDGEARQRGEHLFDEITRAAGFLQELAACGDEQARTPMLADLNTIVRDLEPVLRSVAGGDVEVQLRDTSTPLNVDVGAERIERLLVNLASYGRGRMAPGGRLRIELGTSVVDRHFSAKHRNVRLGLHALITVTETRRVGRESERPKAQKPGVDFATLQGLVSECGGHLWMNVQPAGEMVAKIRLPLLTPPDTKASRVLVARAGRGRTTPRWFQS